jgi:hypothetical protein
MKIEIYRSNWTLDYVKSNPDKIFVFGDNKTRIGKGGQAIIRDMENAIGLRTKKGPSRKPAGYLTDSEYEQNIDMINEDILLIKSLAIQGKTIVFSKNGYGTGLALLSEKAPKTFNYLCESLRNHFGFDNKTGNFWKKVPGYGEIAQGIYISLDRKKDSENIIQPFSNKHFKPEFLSKGLVNIQDLITTDNKVAFTQDISYKKDDIIIFTVTGLSTYFLCRVVDDSYSLSNISKEQWSQFEGFSQEYANSIDIFNDNYYQTHFQFICYLEQSGEMTFRDDIFGGLRIENEKNLDKTINIQDIEKKNENFNKKEDIKHSFYIKFFKYLKYKFSKKDISYILDKKGLTGELSIINNIFNGDKNKIYYKLVSGKYTHFLVLYKGLFVNKVYIVLTFINE